MTKEVAESKLQTWFWMFKYKMVDEYLEHHRRPDSDQDDFILE